MKTASHLLLGLALLGLTAAGCGTNDPLNVFNDPAKVPGLRIPLLSTPTTGQVDAYTSATEGLRFLVTSAGETVVAPADGLVTAVDLTSAGYSITIFFNSHFTINLTNLLSTTKRVGDYVTAGAEVGANSVNRATVKVYYNGGLLCPYPFFNDADRNTLRVAFGTTNPCQN